MTGIEIFLLLAGCVFMIGSFFITEKLSPSELNKIAELSEEELHKIIERELKNADSKIEDAIGEHIEQSMDRVERELEKVTNEKIMAINEYSDTVIENMNKTHNEIMFLYSMLNDKHTELTGLTSDLQRLAADVRSMQESAVAKPEPVPVPVQTMSVNTPIAEEQQVPVSSVQEEQPEMSVPAQKEEKVTELENHNSEILALHDSGVKDIEIARRLGLGLGEVRLVIGLYKGELNP